MDFRDTPEEAAFRAEAVAFLESHARRRSDGSGGLVAFFEDDGTDEEQRAWVKACREWQHTKYQAGFAAISWPPEWGGRGGTIMEEIIFAQEEQRFAVETGAFLISLGMIAPTLMAHGTDEQRAHVARILAGAEVWCQLFSEPTAGSDLAAMRTRADRDGDQWVINGQKVWTSGAHYSDWGYLQTRSDFDAPKHAGLTAFILPMDTPGVTIRPLRQMTGGSSFNEVFFDDVRLPDSARLDAPGNGWRVALTTLMNERFSVGSNTSAARSWNGLVRLARESGRGEDPVVRQRLAQIHIGLETVRFNGYRALTAISKGGTPGPEGSIGKLALTRVMTEMSALMMDLAGPRGTLVSTESLWCTGVPGFRIGGGTDEVMRNIVGERVLRLPPEPSSFAKATPFSALPS
ncbi:MAG TPA: acyl-CoA dehydrogenase family protein [Acidimicrobiia bacterium]|nr:acyl-CoA dehydrogenase family protein [Acidimicrobiia bacterium]